MTKKPTIKLLIKRLSAEAKLVRQWKHIASRYGEKNTAEIKQYLPADPFFLYDYKCLMLINEDGLSEKEAIAVVDEMKPNDWYEVWLELKKMLDNANKSSGLNED